MSTWSRILLGWKLPPDLYDEEDEDMEKYTRLEKQLDERGFALESELVGVYVMCEDDSETETELIEDFLKHKTKYKRRLNKILGAKVIGDLKFYWITD